MNPSAAAKLQFPLEVKLSKKDHASLWIKHYPDKRGPRYRFLHHAEGLPVYVTRRDFVRARSDALQVLERMQNQQRAWLRKTNADAFDHDELVRLANKRNLSAREYLAKADHLFQEEEKRNRGVEPQLFSIALKQFLSAKEAARDKGELSRCYVSSLKHRLGIAEKVFGLEAVPEIARTNRVRSFIGQLPLSFKSKKNVLDALNSFLLWCKGRNYLPGDFRQFRREQVLEGKLRTKSMQIYRPREFADLLTHAGAPGPGRAAELEPLMLAFLGFTGIRTAELLRLEWEDLKVLADGHRANCGHVRISAEDAKTGSRRTIPILPALKEWLPSDARLRRGKIWPLSQAYLHERLAATAKKAGLKWKPNALRHSWISYRLQVTQNKEQVALEAGNSPKIIDSNYKELVGEEEAKEWFAIRPVDGIQRCFDFTLALAADRQVRGGPLPSVPKPCQKVGSSRSSIQVGDPNGNRTQSAHTPNPPQNTAEPSDSHSQEFDSAAGNGS